ncbi:MAG: hypothetical protein ACP5O1_05550 [Phycisphaerae bacterium]
MKKTFRSIQFIVISAVSMMGLAGCSRHSPPTPRGTTYHYIVHGTIVALPVADQGPPQLQINAGPIRHWVQMNGKVRTMPAMVMPYQLGPGVSTAGLKVGEKIVFDYEVNWQQDIAQITSVRPAAAKP